MNYVFKISSGKKLNKRAAYPVDPNTPPSSQSSDPGYRLHDAGARPPQPSNLPPPPTSLDSSTPCSSGKKGDWEFVNQ